MSTQCCFFNAFHRFRFTLTNRLYPTISILCRTGLSRSSSHGSLLVLQLACVLILYSLVLPCLPALADPETDRACLSKCHGQLKRQVEIQGKLAMHVDVAALRSSIHQQLSCLDCHQAIAQIPHKEPIAPVDCVDCHYKGNPRHAPGGGEYRDYVESVHGQIQEDGKKRPRCIDCHGTHDIRPPSDEQSRIYKMRIPETCGQCHTGIYEEYEQSVHGQGLLRDRVLDAPGCVDCHGIHRILSPEDPLSSVYPTHVSQTCAHCHDAVEIVGKYGVSTGRVVSYQQSYHGLANKYGVRAIANCASCHGAHNILPSTDPASLIHPDNLHQTCGQANCHPQAVESFALGPVHLGVVSPPYDIAKWIQNAYIALIVLVIGGMLLHNILDYISIRRRKRHGFH